MAGPSSSSVPLAQGAPGSRHGRRARGCVAAVSCGVLLAVGAAVSVRAGANSLLRWAAWSSETGSQVAVASLALRAGADPDQALSLPPGSADREPFSVLGCAALFGDEGLVKALLRSGANPDGVVAGAAPPVVLAARRGRADALRALLDAGASPNARGFDSRDSALVVATKARQRECMGLLLTAGASTASASANGWAALHWSAERGYSEETRMLLAGGSDPFATDELGRTPSDLSRRPGSEECERLLRAAMAARGGESGSLQSAPTESE